MLAGYVHRHSPKIFQNIARGSDYLSAISNRIAASSERARFLGMIVAIALSDLLEENEKKGIFSGEEIASAEGKWYRKLAKVKDTIGSIADLEPDHGAAYATATSATGEKRAIKEHKPSEPLPKPSIASRIISIEEVDDQTESEEDDLATYEKPDSDLSDEDEDPTLVNRDKPVAPV